MDYALHCEHYSYQLKTPLSLSYGSYAFRDALILKITSGVNVGYGEVTAILYYGWTLEKLLAEAAVFLQAPEKFMAWDPDARAFIRTHKFSELFTPIRAMVDNALWDLNFRIKQKPFYTYLSNYFSNKKMEAVSCMTISGNTLAEYIDALNKNSFPIVKIKCGHDFDLALIQQLKNYNCNFYIDANAGWTLDWIQKHAEDIQAVNIKMLEQPLGVQHNSDNKIVSQLFDFPILADESFQQEEDLQKLMPYFDGFNIKLMKCGGISAALRILEKLKTAQKQSMVGCMTEGSIGISAAAPFAFYTDFCDLDGALLVANDPAQGSAVQPDGTIEISSENGLGVSMIKNN